MVDMETLFLRLGDVACCVRHRNDFDWLGGHSGNVLLGSRGQVAGLMVALQSAPPPSVSTYTQTNKSFCER